MGATPGYPRRHDDQEQPGSPGASLPEMRSWIACRVKSSRDRSWPAPPGSKLAVLPAMRSLPDARECAKFPGDTQRRA